MIRQFTTYVIGIFLFLVGIFVTDACSKQTLKASLKKLERKKISAVRGVHLVHETLKSTKKMTESLDLCKKMGINAVFIRVWHKGEVAFPSEVMKNSANISFDSEKYDHSDPLKFFIKEAHRRKLKVFTIFDFELEGNYRNQNYSIFKKHPNRIAMTVKNHPAMRFNSRQLNTLNPEVQSFVTNLILEMVKFYAPDGVRINTGLTVDAGYDKMTVERYKAENHDATPPKYPRDFEWVEWRADILSDYTEKLYLKIKKAKPKTLIAVMSNEYPKCKADNLRDWIHQVRGGYTDVISPRLYRENINLYRENLADLIHFQVDKEHIPLIFPDISPENPELELTEELVKNIIEAHRKQKIEGEIIPYDILVAYEKYFKEIYKIKAVFPEEIERKKWEKKKKGILNKNTTKAGVADTELEAEEATQDLEELPDEDATNMDETSSPMDDEESLDGETENGI